MQRYDQLYSPQNITCLFVMLCMDSGEDAGQTKEKCLKSVQGSCLVVCYAIKNGGRHLPPND